MQLGQVGDENDKLRRFITSVQPNLHDCIAGIKEIEINSISVFWAEDKPVGQREPRAT
ncbi:hypothetical protein [Janthinobacterium sp. HH01]|uniref:hypothetical protein n=1 Tax=Janthinobacterium sp. HH01 TaxID=1198452 RepID=UPI00034AE225|nr:hypothetical protein [Janthinobacterium sp. HH01]